MIGAGCINGLNVTVHNNINPRQLKEKAAQYNVGLIRESEC